VIGIVYLLKRALLSTDSFISAASFHAV